MKKEICIKCGGEFSLKGGNFSRHVKSCDGVTKAIVPKGTCVHCFEVFDLTDKPKGWMANHTRWCSKNPKREAYVEALISKVNLMNEIRARSGFANQFAKAKLLGNPIPEHPGKGKPGISGKTHSDETRAIISQKALASKHRRLKKNTIWYNGVLLDSSWEVELAKRLDYLGIRWTRPDPIRWTDGAEVEHNYFPDFYLPDYDLYLDPKNPQAMKSQQEKLKYLLTQHRNVFILRTLGECRSFSLQGPPLSYPHLCVEGDMI
jgi:hypothetical protein